MASSSSRLSADSVLAFVSKALTKVREIALRYARRAGLGHDDVEDCASAFVFVLLQNQQAANAARSPLRQGVPADDAERYLTACARNFAFHYARNLRRRGQRELTFAVQTAPVFDEQAADPSTTTTDSTSAAEAQVVFLTGSCDNETTCSEPAEVTALRGISYAQLCQNLTDAAAALPPRQQRAFTLYYLGGETLAAIAAHCGCSEASVKQALHYARLTVRRRLSHLQEK